MFDFNIVVLLLSILSSLIVLFLFIRHDQDKPSRLVYLALYLILTDGLLALLILVQKIDFSNGYIAFDNDDISDYDDDSIDRRDEICRIFHPMMIFLYNTSFGWTILIAIRFANIPFSATGRSPSNDDISTPERIFKMIDSFCKKWFEEPPSYYVPLGAFILFLPLLVLNSIDDVVYTSVVYPPAWVGDRWCIFSNDKSYAIAVNYICFQVPCIVTIVINTYFYTRGVYSLRYAPMSVVTREASRAQSYLAVLLVVWLPGWIGNLLGTLGAYSDGGFGENVMLPIILMSQSGQGLWNTIVYVIGTKAVSRYLKEGSPMKQPLIAGERFVRFEKNPERHSGPSPNYAPSTEENSFEDIKVSGKRFCEEVYYS